MKKKLKRLLREPLVHFLMIGAVLFLAYDIRRDIDDEVPNRIVITQGQQEQLAASFSRTWLRPPTEQELRGLVENLVREEVLYREAVAMGLDKNDAMVRQRMRMKLEFLLEDLSTQDASEETLAAFLAQHPERFRTEVRLSFRQVYLDPDKHEDLEDHAQELLTSLNSGAAPESVGDSTLAPYEYHQLTRSEIARTLGSRFAEEAIKLRPGGWTGPVYSAYGVHLLKVSEYIDAHLPELADIRGRVEREYLEQRRQQQKTLVYNKLREDYQVIIEPSEPARIAKGQVISTAQAGESR